MGGKLLVNAWALFLFIVNSIIHATEKNITRINFVLNFNCSFGTLLTDRIRLSTSLFIFPLEQKKKTTNII
jgi:hypothetical protein